jgi:hypothetical protein
MKRWYYSSDLTNREWAILEPLIPPPKPGGRSVSCPDLAQNLQGSTQNQVGWPSCQERSPTEYNVAGQGMQPT